ncbi:protein RKD5 [Euphorbia lathyris]|uniref:protein RKD5 n=1 Tax=Euphorbia lathyris TaxID=212925 RepID=UPI003313C169
MDFSDHHHQEYPLTALWVFENTINKELIRSLHVYRLKNGEVKEVEREFLFSLDFSYVELPANPVLKIGKFGGFVEGKVFGLWRCVFAFCSGNSSVFTQFPCLLEISSNPKLMSIPSLSYDLQMMYKLSCRTSEPEEKQFLFGEKGESERKDLNQSKRSVQHVLDQDLNCLPFSVASSNNNQTKEFTAPRVDWTELLENPNKRKRAATEDIARIAKEDLVKYFDLPIAEASKNLKVGVTVLKRKCREFGIPRWPHRKIKSLDNLIRNLQEEAECQKQENEEAAKAVAKRQKMLEREKESIERKPFMELQSETKRFRQDVFKRRHRAKVFKKQAPEPNC